jgi:hypothetical protein
MGYAFRFVSTQQDLLDCFDAQRTVRTGMSRWARVIVAGAGLAFLGVAVLAVLPGSHPQLDRWWQPIAWLLIGVVLIWRFAAQPFLAARHIKSSNRASQPLDLTFDNDGISVEAGGVGQFKRSWEEVLAIVPAKRGVILMFADGMAHWLPNRVFSTGVERATFVRYVRSKVPDLGDNEAA